MLWKFIEDIYDSIFDKPHKIIFLVDDSNKRDKIQLINVRQNLCWVLLIMLLLIS